MTDLESSQQPREGQGRYSHPIEPEAGGNIPFMD